MLVEAGLELARDRESVTGVTSHLLLLDVHVPVTSLGLAGGAVVVVRDVVALEEEGED